MQNEAVKQDYSNGGSKSSSKHKSHASVFGVLASKKKKESSRKNEEEED